MQPVRREQRKRSRLGQELREVLEVPQDAIRTTSMGRLQVLHVRNDARREARVDGFFVFYVWHCARGI